MIFKNILAVFFFITGLFSCKYFSQEREKYFEITYKNVVEKTANVDFKGFTKQQIAESVKKYAKKSNYDFIKRGPKVNYNYRRSRVIDQPVSNDTIIYRTFEKICSEDKCYTNLVAKSFIMVTPHDNTVEITTYDNEVFAVAFKDTELQINNQNKVTAIDNQPFSALRIRLFYTDKKDKVKKFIDERDFLAYPDAIYDANGNLINATNKEVIETYFNDVIYELIDHLKSDLKN